MAGSEAEVRKALQSLQQSLRNAVATKSHVMSHTKRLATPSDTAMLREQIDHLLVQLKRMIGEASSSAVTASSCLRNASDIPEARYSQMTTSLQQMVRQLKQVEDEFQSLTQKVVDIEQKTPPQPPSRLRKDPEELPLLGGAGPSGTSSMQAQAQVQTQAQVNAQSVSQREAQQVGQEILDKDKDIHKLVGTAVEIQQVAADIAALIQHQGDGVDQLAVHVGDFSHNVDVGTREIERARARNKKFRIDFCGWLLIVLGTISGLYFAFLITS